MYILYSSQCSNDDWISSLGSSSEHVGIGMLTLQNFDSRSSDVHEISDSNSDDITNGPDPPVTPIVSTRNLLTSSSTTPFDNEKQLLFLYDCETTGGSHYEEHIIEISSAVMAPDKLSITKMEFTSLCYTLHQIDPIGK